MTSSRVNFLFLRISTETASSAKNVCVRNSKLSCRLTEYIDFEVRYLQEIIPKIGSFEPNPNGIITTQIYIQLSTQCTVPRYAAMRTESNEMNEAKVTPK